MTNANKRKGDRAEAAVRDYLLTIWPGTFRTRAGFNDDLGDVITETSRGLFCIQVKDVASPNWSQWFEQLESQVETLRANTTKPVVGGAIVWKLRGKGDPARWRVVTTLDKLPELLEGGLKHGVRV